MLHELQLQTLHAKTCDCTHFGIDRYGTLHGGCIGPRTVSVGVASLEQQKLTAILSERPC